MYTCTCMRIVGPDNGIPGTSKYMYVHQPPVVMVEMAT